MVWDANSWRNICGAESIPYSGNNYVMNEKVKEKDYWRTSFHCFLWISALVSEKKKHEEQAENQTEPSDGRWNVKTLLLNLEKITIKMKNYGIENIWIYWFVHNVW